MQTISISLLKKEAKTIKKTNKITHLESLQFIAEREGYENWNNLIDNCLLIMDSKMIVKINVATSVFHSFYCSYNENLEEIKNIFKIKNYAITANYLISYDRNDYKVEDLSLEIIKLITTVYHETEEGFNPLYLKKLFNLDFLLLILNNNYELFSNNKYINIFFHKSFEMSFYKGINKGDSHMFDYWFICILGSLNTLDSLIIIDKLNLMTLNNKEALMSLKKITTIELILNNRILNSSSILQKYIRIGQQKTSSNLANLYNEKFVKVHELIISDFLKEIK